MNTLETEYLWLLSGSGNIEILAPAEEVEAVAQSGDNKEAVKKLLSNPLVLKQMSYISSSVLIDFLNETGMEVISEETENRSSLLISTLWVLAWDAAENKEDRIASLKEVEKTLNLYGEL